MNTTELKTKLLGMSLDELDTTIACLGFKDLATLAGMSHRALKEITDSIPIDYWAHEYDADEAKKYAGMYDLRDRADEIGAAFIRRVLANEFLSKLLRYRPAHPVRGRLYPYIEGHHSCLADNLAAMDLTAEEVSAISADELWTLCEVCDTIEPYGYGDLIARVRDIVARAGRKEA